MSNGDSRSAGSPASRAGEVGGAVDRVGVPFWLASGLLTVLGGAWGLHATGAHADQPALLAATDVALAPGVEIRLGAADGVAIGEAAQRLRVAWSELGFEARVDRGADDGATDDPLAQIVQVGRLPESLSALGLTVEGDSLATPDGRRWPRSGTAAAITVSARASDVHGKLLGGGALDQAPGSIGDGALITRVVSGEFGDPAAVRALEALAASVPPLGPRMIVWSGGVRVFEAPVNADGYVVAAEGRSYPAHDPSMDVAEESEAEAALRKDVVRRAAGVIRAVANVSGRSGGEIEPAPRIRFVASTADRAPDGAVHRVGWYSAAGSDGTPELVLLKGADAAADDALFALAEAKLAAGLGPAGTRWFARGIAFGLLGRCGGLDLTEIESRSGGVTIEEVMGLALPRTRVTLAPAEARLARSLMVTLKASPKEAWAVRVADDPELIERLKATWNASFEQSPIEPRLAMPRSIREGVLMEMELTRDAFGEGLRADLRRLARLGFAGVQFAVHVPVAPPGAGSFVGAERQALPAAVSHWGSHVTVEGDGEVIEAALFARSLGLSVVLAPQFVASATGSLGRKQIHGTAGRVQAYGNRRGLAMEGVSWLAEMGEVDGIVMFDPEDLPRADPNAWPPYAPELTAAYESTRRQSLVYSQPFAGDRLTFARGQAAIESTLAANLTAGFGGALAVINLKLGLEADLTAKASIAARAEALVKTVEATDGNLWAVRIHGLGPSGGADPWGIKSRLAGEAPGPSFHFVGRWSLAGSEEPGEANLRELDDESLGFIARGVPLGR